ncbi:MAG: ankyrin repeat domain-containing protein [Bacteriovoracaceae bacterium]|nr:ankyrin repeat domain-containing protein [Bacteriovoracaceae bacterium]
MKTLHLIITIFIAASCAKKIENSTKVDELNYPVTQGYEKTQETKKVRLLEEAIKTGALDLVQEALSSGANPNILNSQKETALTYAIKENHPLIVNELIRAGSDVNKENGFNELPIHLSVKSANRALVKSLLSSPKLNTESLNIKGQTALMKSIELKEDSITYLLIDSGASVIHTDYFENTILDLSISLSDSRMNTLIHAIVALENNQEEQNALLNLINTGDLKTLSHLEKRIKAQKQFSFDKEILEALLNVNEYQAIKFLKFMNKRVVFSSEDLNWFMIETVKKGRYEQLRVLYASYKKINTDSFDNEYRNALSYAIENLNLKTIYFLIDKGAKVYPQNGRRTFNSCRYLKKNKNALNRNEKSKIKVIKRYLGC